MPQPLDDCTATVGSGNVFADIGVPDPEFALAKAQLAGKIYETIRAKGWTQVQAAKAMGVDQPKVSEIVRGRVRGYTIDRLMTYLIRLGQGVTFTFPPQSPDSEGVKGRVARRAHSKPKTTTA